MKWGTSNPIIVRDPEFGMVRVRGFGSYSFKVDNVEVFLKELFGTNSSYETEDIAGWLKTLLVSYISDAIGESKVSILDMAGNTLEFNEIVKRMVQTKFKEIGLALVSLVIENFSLPAEVEKKIDERSGLGVLADSTDVMMKVAAAEAMRDAAKNPGMAGGFMGAGVGVGAGVGIGQVFADAFKNEPKNEPSKPSNAGGKTCPSCGSSVSANAKFCPECGEKMPVNKFCTECGAKVDAGAKFCPECGNKL
jgi:membrane protease subunit (stomatin/prohibitin family)